MFDKPLEYLSKNEDDLSSAEERSLKGLVRTLNILPAPARHAIFEKVPAPYGVTGVFAGETEAVHEHTMKKAYDQYLVPLQGQCDILISGIPYISPYNVNSFLNPLLVAVMAQGYLYNLHKGAPVVRKGGTLIIFHQCTDKFDRDQHPAYVEFFHKFLTQTRDAMELHKRFEREFSKNPAFVQMYRTGSAYHPAHPFYMWYWGENGRQHLGRVIVVGADNEYIPGILGYETARNFDEALRMAKETAPEEPDITCLHLPPVFIADVTLDPEPKAISAEDGE